MASSQSSILKRTVSREIFDNLSRLWQKTAKVAGHQALFVSDDVLLLEEEKLEQECFRLLICQQVNALLLGNPVISEEDIEQVNSGAYEISITFDSKEIANFLEQLSEHITHNEILKGRLQTANLPPPRLQANLQKQFILQLLEILAIDNFKSSSSEIAYPHFSLQPTEKVLHHRLEQERILNQVTFQISQNLDLLEIVQMTIDQVQGLIEVDRLVIYQLDVASESGDKLVDAVTYESRATEEIPSILHFQDETCFRSVPQCRDKYRQGFSLTIENVAQDPRLSPCLRLLMERLQVKAKLVTPIIVQGQIWGLLIAHQCISQRQWKENETKFLCYIAEYLAIAIYQTQSYQQLQEQKNLLEQEINQKVQELNDALLAAQAANQSKSEFLGTMSHELRTPLTCIIGLSSTLLHWSLNNKNFSLPIEKQRQYLQTIQENGKQLLKLINDILDFSQVEAGRILLDVKEFSLHKLTRIVLQSLQENAGQKDINLELDFRVEVKNDIFCADQKRVQQILSHLLDNAIKFTPTEGKVILRVWSENSQTIFQVEDTGIGISEYQLPLLFKKFQQLEKSIQRTYGGAGLGLALTKQLIELHQGSIEVKSIPGKGSLFTVRLPNQPLNYTKTNQLLTNSTLSSSKVKTIVLIEQNEEIATLICELLTAANHQVVWLIDSSTAINQIELLQPIIVILDHQFPGIKIPHISQTLKQIQTTKDIKMLVLSNKMTPTDWQYLLKNGVDTYLLKPVQPTELLEKVNALLSN